MQLVVNMQHLLGSQYVLFCRSRVRDNNKIIVISGMSDKSQWTSLINQKILKYFFNSIKRWKFLQKELIFTTNSFGSQNFEKDLGREQLHR